ncbi:MAG: hypothetical protein ACLS7X_01835 [Mediterraneibacter gnavus]
MINVAICDDVVATTGKIETMLQSIAKRNFIPIDTDVFWEGGHLAASRKWKWGILLILSFWI